MKSQITKVEQLGEHGLYTWNKYPVAKEVSYVWNRELHKKEIVYNWKYAPATTFTLNLQQWVKRKKRKVTFVKAFKTNENFGVFLENHKKPYYEYNLVKGYNAKNVVGTTIAGHIIDLNGNAPIRTVYYGNTKNEDLGIYFNAPRSPRKTEENGNESITPYGAALGNMDYMAKTVKFCVPNELLTSELASVLCPDYTENNLPDIATNPAVYEAIKSLQDIMNTQAFKTDFYTSLQTYVNNRRFNPELEEYLNWEYQFDDMGMESENSLWWNWQLFREYQYDHADELIQNWIEEANANINAPLYSSNWTLSLPQLKFNGEERIRGGVGFPLFNQLEKVELPVNTNNLHFYGVKKPEDWTLHLLEGQQGNGGVYDLDVRNMMERFQKTKTKYEFNIAKSNIYFSGFDFAFMLKNEYRNNPDIWNKFSNIEKFFNQCQRWMTEPKGPSNYDPPIERYWFKNLEKKDKELYDLLLLDWNEIVLPKAGSFYKLSNIHKSKAFTKYMKKVWYPVFTVSFSTRISYQTIAGYSNKTVLQNLIDSGYYYYYDYGIMTKDEAEAHGYQWSTSYDDNIIDDSVAPVYFFARSEIDFESDDDWQYDKIGEEITQTGLFPYFQVKVPSYARYNLNTLEYIDTVYSSKIVKVPIVDTNIADLPTDECVPDNYSAFHEIADMYSPTIWIDDTNPNILNIAQSYTFKRFVEKIDETVSDYFPNNDYYYAQMSWHEMQSLGDELVKNREGYWFYSYTSSDTRVAEVIPLGTVSSLLKNTYPDGDYYDVDGLYYELTNTKIDNFTPLKAEATQVIASHAYAYPSNGLQVVNNEIFYFELISKQRYSYELNYDSLSFDGRKLIGNVEYDKTLSKIDNFPFCGVVSSSIKFKVNTPADEMQKYIDNVILYSLAPWTNSQYKDKGLFIIKEIDSLSDHNCQIIAYDLMVNFNKIANNILSQVSYPIKMKNFIQLICQYCQVDYFPVSFLQEELLIESAPNVSESEEYTFRDVLEWISQIIPGFIMIDSEGYLRIKPLENHEQAWGSFNWNSYSISTNSDATIVPISILYKDQVYGNVLSDEDSDLYWDFSHNGLLTVENFDTFVANTQNMLYNLSQYTFSKQKIQLPELSLNVEIGDFWVNAPGENKTMGIITEIQYDGNGFTVITDGKERPNMQPSRDSNTARIEETVNAIQSQFQFLEIKKVVFYTGQFNVYKQFNVDVSLTTDNAIIRGINGDLTISQDGSYGNEVVIDVFNAIVKFLGGESVGLVQLFNSGTYYGNENVDPKLASGWTTVYLQNNNELWIRCMQ